MVSEDGIQKDFIFFVLYVEVLNNFVEEDLSYRSKSIPFHVQNALVTLFVSPFLVSVHVQGYEAPHYKLSG